MLRAVEVGIARNLGEVREFVALSGGTGGGRGPVLGARVPLPETVTGLRRKRLAHLAGEHRDLAAVVCIMSCPSARFRGSHPGRLIPARPSSPTASDSDP